MATVCGLCFRSHSGPSRARQSKSSLTLANHRITSPMLMVVAGHSPPLGCSPCTQARGSLAAAACGLAMAACRLANERGEPLLIHEGLTDVEWNVQKLFWNILKLHWLD